MGQVGTVELSADALTLLTGVQAEGQSGVIRLIEVNTPAGRLLLIQNESRLVILKLENRNVIIKPSDGLLVVKPEHRFVVMVSDNRDLDIKPENRFLFITK